MGKVKVVSAERSWSGIELVLEVDFTLPQGLRYKNHEKRHRLIVPHNFNEEQVKQAVAKVYRILKTSKEPLPNIPTEFEVTD